MKIYSDYQGRPIRLTSERLEHILEHPEMRGLENDIVKVLAQPELVVQSLSDPQALLYYQLLLQTRVGVKWLCVVVKIAEADAFILTAYLTDKPKKGVQLWPGK